MSIVIAALFIVSVVWALLSNDDLFSPAKFFLLSFLAFHVGALLGDTPFELWLLISLVLLVGFAAVLFEALLPRSESKPIAFRRSLERDDAVLRWIWALSLPAFLAQLYLIDRFGGIEGYVNVIGLRVVEWRGLGWARTLIATLAAFNLIYFAIGLTRSRNNSWWAGYGVHFLLLIVIGLLSGSRSGVLNIIAMQAFTFHYLKRPVKLKHALMLVASLMFFATMLGIIRDGLKLDSGELTTGLEVSSGDMRVATLYYGIEPLQILLDAGPLRLAYGSTFVSLLTNPVPRDWWPEKPDTGGVFFTKEYTNDAWDGASNLTPTFMGEWIINFGWILGIALFMIAYPLLMHFVVRYYRRIRERIRGGADAPGALAFLAYLFTMWAAVGLMTGEITSVLLNLMLTQLVPVALIGMLVTRKNRHRARLGHSGILTSKTQTAST